MNDAFEIPQERQGPVTHETDCGVARVWMALAVSALLISTGYVLVIVLARSGFAHWLDFTEAYFHTALVLHVDFALIVWLLAIAAMIWTLSGPTGQRRWSYLDPFLSAGGVTLMLLSPLAGTGQPIVSDYILVLDHPLFLLGLGLFFSGVGLVALRFLMTTRFRQESPDWRGISQLAVKGSVLAFLSAMATFILAAIQLWDQPGGPAFYSQLFWGAGHLLQFAYLFLLIAAWVWLWRQAGYSPVSPGVVYTTALWLLMLLALSGPLLYLLLDESRAAFTGLMEIGGTLALCLLLLWLFQMAAKAKGATGQSVFAHVAAYSMALFIAGTLSGFFIHGNDAVVPAHYHGMVGAVTLAFMGLAYRLCPLLGLGPPSGQAVMLQARLYAAGIALVMLGLILSDLPRKALAGDAALDMPLLAGRILMAVGGSAALLASLLFIALIWQGFHHAAGKGAGIGPMGSID